MIFFVKNIINFLAIWLQSLFAMPFHRKTLKLWPKCIHLSYNLTLFEMIFFIKNIINFFAIFNYNTFLPCRFTEKLKLPSQNKHFFVSLERLFWNLFPPAAFQTPAIMTIFFFLNLKKVVLTFKKQIVVVGL